MRLIKKEIKQNFTVDCEVEDTHCYQLENGLISHNTLSILGGSTPGIHPAYSKYYMRTIRVSSSDKLVKACRDAGYRCEFLLKLDGSEQHDTVVIYFPCITPDGAVLAKDMDVIKQLEMVKLLQSSWSDNSVSVTAYYKEEELGTLQDWLKLNYEKNIKSVSFLLHKEHGFKQAPYIEITEEEYNEARSKIKKIVMTNDETAMIQGIECEGGACPIR
jgi:ribonucleotide reductase alpha subunit